MGHFGTIRIFHRTETPDWEILQLFSIIRRFRQLVTMIMTCDLGLNEVNKQSVLPVWGLLKSVSESAVWMEIHGWLPVCGSNMAVCRHCSVNYEGVW